MLRSSLLVPVLATTLASGLVACGESSTPPGVDAGPACDPLADSDRDGIPDCDDPDANGDGIPDADTPPGDLDGDGLPDADDPDIDGDTIPNSVELGADGRAVDTDEDGIDDYRDLDSDGDLIADAQELERDVDGDGVPSFRDTDSDGDGVPDRVEAGDEDLETAAFICPNEIDRSWEPTFDPAPPPIEGDGVPDFLDPDSDDDGLPDGLEDAIGTDRCDWDSDGDGAADVFEALVDDLRCLRGTEPDCGAATNGDRVPEDASYVLMTEDRVRTRRAWLQFESSTIGDVRPAASGLPEERASEGRAFLAASRPTCQWIGFPVPLPKEVCWEPPEDVPAEDAVELVDGERFSRAVPGTRVEFEVLLENFHIDEGSAPQTFGAVLSIPGTDHLFVIRVPPDTDVEG